MKYIIVILIFLLNFSTHDDSSTSYVKALNIFVDIHEVSVSQFQDFINQTNYHPSEKAEMKYFDYKTNKWIVSTRLDWKKPNNRFADSDHPVTQVNYKDACAYCHHNGGRLPTAEEWTFFADRFIDGNIWYGLFPFTDYNTDGYKTKMAPIKQFSANPYGLFDVYGNAWELTSDTNDLGQVAIKGGSFLCDFSLCSGNQQLWVSQHNSANDIGFRCVYDKEL